MLNKYIDHTLLKADATRKDIDKLCQEAIEYDFKTVCVNPTWIAYCKQQLKGSDVGVCTVIGFPLGATLSSVKAFETVEAIKNGADEIDMVINIGALKDRNMSLVESDIKAVVQVAQDHPVKVIIETCLLTDEEIKLACIACLSAKATFVKTSTGFSTGGATVEAVALIKSVVGDQALIKAAGGVRNSQDLQQMIAAGANRIGTSSGVKLMQGEKTEGNY